MEIRIQIGIFPSEIYQRVSENHDDWSEWVLTSDAIIMENIKAAQNKLRATQINWQEECRDDIRELEQRPTKDAGNKVRVCPICRNTHSEHTSCAGSSLYSFDTWLDKQAAQQSMQRTGLESCPECGGVGYHKKACKFGVYEKPRAVR